MRGYVRAGCAAAVLALVSACGTQHADTAMSSTSMSSTSMSSTSPTSKALPPICPQAAAAVPASPCVPVGVEQNQQSNEMYNVRAPMPSWLAAEAHPETQRIRHALEGLTRAQRQNPSAVESALRGAGMLSSGLVAYGPWDHEATFGG